jgi:hypothetical protein
MGGSEIQNFDALPFVIAFPIIWTLTVVLIARIGGWSQLAREYPARTQLGGRRFRFQSGRMRLGTGYGSCLMVGSDPAGLHLEVLFPFRPGHPALFIPWSDVTVRDDRKSVRGGITLGFSRVPEVPLVLSGKLVEQLADASSGAFRYARVD